MRVFREGRGEDSKANNLQKYSNETQEVHEFEGQAK